MTTATLERFPLSSPQQLWCGGDRGDDAGYFAKQFTMAAALRVSGYVDIPALRGALDDVVARHEILRTVVLCDRAPRQELHEPCPVPLTVRDLPEDGRPRDLVAEELLDQAERSGMNPRDLPLLRAGLHRFDDTDSVLTLVTHHTVSDEWSVQVIIRDLAACYRARVAGTTADLPEPVQYRDFSEYQTAGAAGPAADRATAYWRDTLRGAGIFSAPADRPVPEVHSRACSAHYFTVDAGVLEAAGGSTRAVLIAAFNVLIQHIAGSTDQSVDTLTTGRTQPRFADSVGPLMNFLVYRTDIADCVTFADVVARTARTCADADANEIPIQHIERALPELMAPNDDVMSANCILGVFQPPFTAAELRIAEDSRQIHRRTQRAAVGPWIPHGVAWALHLSPNGGMAGLVQFNTQELDPDTVAGWVSRFTGILANAADADRDWRTL